MPGVKRNIHKGKSLGIFTSGGDSSGMNGAIRACVRMAIFLGCQPYLIYEGYQGLVDGGKYFVKAKWTSVSQIIHRGGTIIGTARCSEFREREGRLKAALNLVQNEINRLVVIGGDGSLTGANIFRQEWPSLMDELLKSGKINAKQRDKFTDMHIVGLVGSIDNDFCGTDMTIGVDSALQRITDAIDAITSTAYSHQRTFVMEVMGRNCGYLSLIAGFVAEADYVFCPEMPPPHNWQDQMCEKLTQVRHEGLRVNIIIIAEGATDMDGKTITAEMVKQVIVDRLQYDTRVTVLGHVQRGGQPSAYDRILSCRMGAEATIAVLESTSTTVPVVIGIEGVHITRVPLMEAVQRTQAVAKAMADRQWDVAVKLRGYWFGNTLETIHKMCSAMPRTGVKKSEEPVFRLGVMHVGSAACGMNAAVRSFVHHVIGNGDIPYGISNGFDGLVSGNFKQLLWTDVNGWVAQGGAFLGITRTPADGKYQEIARNLKAFQIHGLLIIGGFEAYRSMLLLFKQRNNFPEFCIPMAVIPSTPSNNMPGTDYTLGSDTSLNEIVEITDRIRNSARGSGKRVFIIETMGAYCGYLATMAAMAGGADTAYIFEEKFTVTDIRDDVVHMIAKMNDGLDRGLVLRAEFASENYSTDFIFRLFNEEGKGTFTTGMSILGHLQQGGTPSPFDRGFGTRLGAKMSDWFKDQLSQSLQPDKTVRTTTNESACMLGIVGAELQFTPLVELITRSDFQHNIPKSNWFLQLRPLLKILSLHDSAYDDVESQFTHGVDVNCAVH